MSVLETRNVFYSYTKGNIILSGINAVFETGKLHVIIGPSGSGKTTLLSLLGGLDSPGKRENLFDGEDIAERGLEYHRRQHVSLIFQSYNLIDYLTPVENVKLTARQDALPVLKRLGLSAEEAGRSVLKLSPAGSSSGWLLPVHWLPVLLLSWLMNPQAIWMRIRRPK